MLSPAPLPGSRIVSTGLYAIGFTGAIAIGAALPLMTLVFGRWTTSFDNYAVGQADEQHFTHTIHHLVLHFVCVLAARFVIGYILTLCICVAAASTTRSLRKAFLEILLRQQVGYFDKQSTGSATTQVTTSRQFVRFNICATDSTFLDGVRVNQGIAEKLYAFIQDIGLFFPAYIVAIAVQWGLAPITMSVVPATVL